MIKDEWAFLKMIWRRPGDMTTRLVYADWLDEHGHSWEAEAVRFWVGLTPMERNTYYQTFRYVNRNKRKVQKKNDRYMYDYGELDRTTLAANRNRRLAAAPAEYKKAVRRIYEYAKPQRFKREKVL